MEWNGEEISLASILISLFTLTIPFWKKALKIIGDIFLIRLNNRKEELLEEDSSHRGTAGYLDLRGAVDEWEREGEGLFLDDSYKN